MANLGYGGINYGTADKKGKQGIIQNQQNVANSPAYKQSEIDRTLGVIESRKAQGLDTSAQQKYLNVNLGYQAPMVQAASNVTSSPQATYTPPSSPTQDTLNRMNDFINRQAEFQFTAPDPFVYDQNSDPAYQSQLAEAKRNVESQQRDTNAMLRASGQGMSSWSESVANQIGTNAMASIANNLVPALMQQAYQRYNDDANRSLQVQQLNYGVGQDALGNLTNLYGLQDNEYFQKPITEAQLTGNYLPTEARQAIDQILNLKQQWGASSNAQDRAEFARQAETLRNQLERMGIDSSLYGANVSYADAARANPGVRTLAGQQLDMQRQGQQFDQQFAQDQFAYQKVRDQIRDEQWKMQFDQDVNQFGLQHALSRQVQLGGLSIDQARLALSADDNARQWAALDWEMMNPSGSSRGGLTANQILQSMQSLYTEPVFQDNKGIQEKVGDRITQDPTKREQMFLNVVDAGLSDAETLQILSSLGMTKTEIENYKKKHPGN
ncbi:hypothetical protein [Paenibacillus bouchesdurhonensis]|uniref:hypothetical protein n=1 Tax=Paenibacillus bouchesdurhonensis TaxID=1870990 RepID=UPI000DA60025|nr:hypothetical protein [Paenibacillus bouchesdurhonensis]